MSVASKSKTSVCLLSVATHLSSFTLIQSSVISCGPINALHCSPTLFRTLIYVFAAVAIFLCETYRCRGGAGGFLLGGIIIKRMALTCRQALRGMFLLAIVGLGTMFMFAIHCDTAPLADATSHQRHSHTRRYAAPTARLCIIHEHGSEFLDPSHCCFMVHGFRSDTTISRPNS